MTGPPARRKCQRGFDSALAFCRAKAMHPTPRPQGAGVLEGKQVGRGFTAARRQASRLAGLVRLPAVWPIQTAIRRQASWLATKASMDLKSRWPFVLQKYQAASKHPNPQGLRMPPPTMNQNSRPLISAAKSSSHAVASQPARGAYAPRRLRRSRAAIGSGGKKARPF